MGAKLLRRLFAKMDPEAAAVPRGLSISLGRVSGCFALSTLQAIYRPPYLIDLI